MRRTLSLRPKKLEIFEIDRQTPKELQALTIIIPVKYSIFLF